MLYILMAFFILLFIFLILRLAIAIQSINMPRINTKKFIINPNEENDIPHNEMHNFRHIAALPTQDGRHIKPLFLFRSAHLSVKDEKISVLIEKFGIATIVDLRSPQEQRKLPDAKLNLKALSRPIKQSDQSMVSLIIPLVFKRSLTKDTTHNYYIHLLSECAEAFGEALRPVMDNSNGGILYHCLAGKDRTGLVIYLLLMLCKVDFKLILEEYSQTNRHFTALMNDQFRNLVIRSLFKPRDLAHIVLANPEWLIKAHEWIEKKFGSVENYLLTAGKMNPEELEKIKLVMIDS